MVPRKTPNSILAYSCTEIKVLRGRGNSRSVQNMNVANSCKEINDFSVWGEAAPSPGENGPGREPRGRRREGFSNYLLRNKLIRD